jgi:sigma-B regulation protein RsbU (phosphoserine phosphatase)
MLRDDAIALVRQMRDAANRHDIPRLMDFYADDAVARSPVFAEVTGKAAIAATWERVFSMFPDCALDMSEVLVDGDRIGVLGTLTATDRLGWFGLPPTGGVITYRLALLMTVSAGRIVHEERLYDSAGVVARLEKALVDRELTTAAEVQRALLSRAAYHGGYCEAVGHSLPCRAIGGDFFEFVELPSGSLGIALGDVAGKGLPAALLAAMLQGMVAAEAAAGDGPAKTLSRMNRRMAERHLEARYATLVYGVLSPDGRFAYANAGHNPPALVGREGIHRLTTGGPILGAFAEAAFEEETLQLKELETLVMFTDGVTEARNVENEEYGEDRLISCVTSCATCAPSVLLGSLFGAVREFSGTADQTDDITVTVTRFLDGRPAQP